MNIAAGRRPIEGYYEMNVEKITELGCSILVVLDDRAAILPVSWPNRF